jgi:CO/xanthine dehydrogenase FAD-binding subunit
MARFELLTPASVDEAIASLRATDPVERAVLAGGTDLLNDLEDGRLAASRVISLRRLPWRTLDRTGEALRIGSTLPLRALELDAEVRRSFPALADAVHAVGSVALRHRATLGGNLGRAAPSSDLLPVLLVLDAEVELVGPAGPRTLPVDRFLRASRRTELAPDELIRSVRLAEPRPSAYLWQRVRPAHDISQVAVAVAHSAGARAWRVAVGGVPPRPALLAEAAAALGPGAPSDAALGRARELASRAVAIVADRRASEEYRRHLVGTLFERAVRLATARGAGPP